MNALFSLLNGRLFEAAIHAGSMVMFAIGYKLSAHNRGDKQISMDFATREVLFGFVKRCPVGPAPSICHFLLEGSSGFHK